MEHTENFWAHCQPNRQQKLEITLKSVHTLGLEGAGWVALMDQPDVYGAPTLQGVTSLKRCFSAFSFTPQKKNEPVHPFPTWQVQSPESRSSSAASNLQGNLVARCCEKLFESKQPIQKKNNCYSNNLRHETTIKQSSGHMLKQTDKEANNQTNKETNKQNRIKQNKANKRTDRQTDKPTN